MNIGITCYPTAGGSGIVATELGQQLAMRGHKVHFIAYDMPFRLDRFQPNLQYHAVESTAYPLFKFDPYSLPLAVKMADVSRTRQLDILHVHYAIPHATCAYLAKQLLADSGSKQPKIITTLHGTDITLVGVDPTFFDMTQFSIRQSDGITAVSNYLADETREVFGIEKEIRVIYNFIDTNRFKPSNDECSRREFAKPEEFLIGHVSNFRPVKRTLDVIDIFDRIAAELPAKLLLVGEGPDTTLARRAVTRKGLTDKVIFLGSQNRIEAILPCLDLMLMPSEDESFGLAALESLACGVPVIGTLNTGLVEVISDGKNGFLRPIGDTAAMASAGMLLLKNASILAEFKRAAHTISHERFNSQKLITEYENYYTQVLNG
jgi:N-acetyl-alpha-D-glucosaminyl L-malate synthase BshA